MEEERRRRKKGGEPESLLERDDIADRIAEEAEKQIAKDVRDITYGEVTVGVDEADRIAEEAEKQIASDIRDIMAGKAGGSDGGKESGGGKPSPQKEGAAESGGRSHSAQSESGEEGRAKRPSARREGGEEGGAKRPSAHREGAEESGAGKPSGRKRGSEESAGGGTRTSAEGIKGDKDTGNRKSEPGKAQGSGGKHGSQEEKSGGRKKRPFTFVSYAFVLIFVALIGYIVYFQVFLKDGVLASPYNKRQDDLSTYVIRGSIFDSQGNVLASTSVDESGNETRVYPYGSLFAHTVGYYTNGKSGLESKLNYTLLTSHYNLIERVKLEFNEEKAPGDNVTTTLSVPLQQTAYAALGSYRGAVIAMDPETGEILAMVSKPDFDPNTIAADWSAIVGDPSNSQLLNRATQGLYAPGSAFKIATSLAYLKSGASVDSFSYECTGQVETEGHTIHCADGAVHGQEDLTRAFAVSCNCAFAEIGKSLGAGALISAADGLLFGKSLPCPIASSKSKITLEEDDGEFLTMETAFGQGTVVVTPYHMALITAAAANGGMLMEPYMISRIESADGTYVSETKSAEYRRLMSESEASAIYGLMRAAVTDGSANALYALTPVCAGKTGTAEFTRTDGTTGTHSWFTGTAELDGKKLVVTVLAEDSSGGAATAVPIAAQVIAAYFG